MCGRYTQTHSAESLARAFQLADVPPQEPRYNIAPAQPVAAAIGPNPSETASATRAFKMLRWGLIPSWAKDAKIGAKLINARAETVADKPSFRAAFRRRRCLVVADGFYEWQNQGGQKQPFYIRLKEASPFAFAGLWEHWQDAAGELIESCTILTTAANEMMQPIHPRMPVILNPKDYDLWLDPQVQDVEVLKPLLVPYRAEAITAYRVNLKVNNARYDRPDCIERQS